MSTPLIPALEVRDASVTFKVGRGPFRPAATLKAVQGVNLVLPPGKTLAIVGESGCGKSTLSRAMLGIQRLDHGDIRVNGRSIGGIERMELARCIQPIFQDPYSSLNPSRTVEQILRQPLEIHRRGTAAERRARAERMLDLVRLPKRTLTALPSELSGGQRQRIAIGRALMLEPQIVVCDEPTSALDVSVQAQVLNILSELQRDMNLAYVFVSHNLAVVEHLADEVAVMYLGRIVEQSEARALFRSPRHPYTRALLQSLLTPEPGRTVPRPDLRGSFPNAIDPPSGCAFHPRCASAQPRCGTQAPVLSRPGAGLRQVACHVYG